MMTLANCCDESDRGFKLTSMSKKLCLIPGENIIRSSILTNYLLTMTEYRLYLIYENAEAEKIDDEVCHVSIPLALILKVEQLEFKRLRLLTKIGGMHILSFDTSENCSLWLRTISDVLLPTTTLQYFAFQFLNSMKCCLSSMLKNCPCDKRLYRSYDFILVQNEFNRMKFDKSWQITDVNRDFKICHSYPRFHIVPSSITNEDIRAMAEFRGNKRFPSVVWRSQMNGAVLIRCAQPQVGLMCWRNSSDETFFKEVMTCLNVAEKVNVKKLLIIDARHYSTAQFNRIRGGGVEFSEYYGEAEIMFMQLENIHSVRSSFDYISLFAVNSETWLTNLENSYWLKYLSKLLKSASDIARALSEEGRSVIIHCSDGWDRTPQLTSLSQILLDGYYRSIEGFQVLIEKEWLQFGHKFADRCGSNKPIDHKERSPVFVQWLDCVHQLIKQYPRYFEFNETFLIKLAIHIHSGLFGNFLYNTEEERIKNDISNTTMSIWNFISETNDTITNPLYYKNSDSDESHFYERVIYPKHNTKFILPWNKLFFEALNPLDSHRIFSIDYSSTKPLINHQQSNNEEFQEEEEITNVQSMNDIFPLRKFKSDTNLSTKFNRVSSFSDEYTSLASSMVICDTDLTKYNGKFINQTSSTSTMNDGVTNGFLNENNSVYTNNEAGHKSINTGKYLTTELVAFSNGVMADLTNQETAKGDFDNQLGELIPKNSFNSIKTSPRNNFGDRHFRLIDTDDKKDIYISPSHAPFDFDGLYLFTEPINRLARQWNIFFNSQKSIISELKERLNCETQHINKARTDSASSNERFRNEDSLSSHGSFIILESPEVINNHCDKSINEVVNNGRIGDSKLKLNGRSGYTYNSSDHCHYNKALFTPAHPGRSLYNQPSYSECDTASNGSEKVQA